jgi:hypothetical protein
VRENSRVVGFGERNDRVAQEAVEGPGVGQLESLATRRPKYTRDSVKEREPAEQLERRHAGQHGGVSDKEPCSADYDTQCYDVC